MITMRAILAALTNAVRGWRPIATFAPWPGHRVDVWLEIPASQDGAHPAHRFRVADAWRDGAGEWRHNSGTPLRGDFITCWRARPPAPRSCG